ncbi:hypothetical protein C8F01DRAFT_1135782 [Mycena amicta]|nr:hypothetical protein C8F01DRAFT_1135782 [Mycena amicta]
MLTGALSPIERIPSELFQQILEEVVSDAEFISLWHTKLALVSSRFKATLLHRPDLYVSLTLPTMHLSALRVHLKYSAPKRMRLTIERVDRQDWDILFTNGARFDLLDVTGPWSHVERFGKRCGAFSALLNLRLDVDDRSVLTSPHKVLVADVPGLKTLVLAGGNISTSAAVCIAGNQPTIKHLSLISALHSKGPAKTRTTAPNLEFLSLEDTHHILRHILLFLVAPSLHCLQIFPLNLDNIPQLSAILTSPLVAGFAKADSYTTLKLSTFFHMPQRRQRSSTSHHGTVQDPAFWGVRCAFVDGAGKELVMKLLMRGRLETTALVIVCLTALAQQVADMVVDSRDSGCSLTESEWLLLLEVVPSLGSVSVLGDKDGLTAVRALLELSRPNLALVVRGAGGMKRDFEEVLSSAESDGVGLASVSYVDVSL